jgi:DHA2 family multidrug resistance protein
MSAEAAATLPVGARRFILVAATTLGTAAYDFTWTVVGVALPHMQGSFSATPDQVAWVMTGFIVGSAMMMASVGWITARFGRRQLFLFAMAGYTITLVGCGLADTLFEEVMWRFGQGVVGAPLIPLGQAIAVDAFPPESHGKATSFWGIGVVAGGAFGPVAGGALIEHLGWPWIYYVTVPIGVISLVASWLVVPETPRNPDRKLDWFGFATLMTSVVAIQLMLSRGERLDWFDSAEVVAEGVVAGLAFYLYLVHTATAKHPFINRALFRNRNYVLGLVFLLSFGAIIILPNVLLPLLLVNLAGYPVIETGYLLIPRGVGVVIGLLVIGQVEHRVDARTVIFVCLLFYVFTGWQMSLWTIEVTPWDVMWPNFVQGLCGGVMWVPVSTLALATLDKRVQDEGYAVFYLQFDVGSAAGVAGVIALHTRQTQTNHALLSEHVNPFNELFGSPKVPEVWDIAEASGLAALDHEVTRQAMMIAYNNSFLLMTLMAAALLPMAFVFRRSRPRPAGSGGSGPVN